MGQCRCRCRWRCHCEHARLSIRFVRPTTSAPSCYLDACANAIPRIKTRLQVQVKRSQTDAAANPADDEHYDSALDALQKVYAQEGLSGLYAGMGGALLGVASTNFAYFYWYTIVRTLYMSRRSLQTSPGTAVELSLGAVAGALAQLFTIPVAVVTTRQQTMSKAERKGMIATAMDVVNGEDGWTGLWRGLRASLVLVVNPSITYGAYQRLREVLYPGKKTLKPLEAFRKSFPNSFFASQVSLDKKPNMQQFSARFPRCSQQSQPSPSSLPKSACSQNHRHPETASLSSPLPKSCNTLSSTKGPWRCSKVSGPRSSRVCLSKVSS
jgi:hypothetical protein